MFPTKAHVLNPEHGSLEEKKTHVLNPEHGCLEEKKAHGRVESTVDVKKYTNFLIPLFLLLYCRIFLRLNLLIDPASPFEDFLRDKRQYLTCIFNVRTLQ